MAPPSNVHDDAARHRRALRELRERHREAAAPRLFRAQREHRAPRFRQTFLRQIADARRAPRRAAGPARTAPHLFGRAELHEDAGERLRETVVNLLADAIALDEHRRRLARMRETRELDGERRLLAERHEQLRGLRADGFAMTERRG